MRDKGEGDTRFSVTEVRRVLELATEIEESSTESMPLDELRSAAIEAGISESAVLAACSVVRAERDREASRPGWRRWVIVAMLVAVSLAGALVLAHQERSMMVIVGDDPLVTHDR
jgi:hypothetical protein